MRTRRSHLAALVASLALSAALVAGAAPARAGALPASTAGDTTTTTAPPTPNIIPRPDSGQEPDDAGDRGGALQLVVFGIVIAGPVLIGLLVVRESRKKRAERGF